MAIAIRNADDWQQLVAGGLTTVVDPLVLRCGELFLKGANGNDRPAEAWELLQKNIYAVGMFIDSLILQERIPVFNYGDTFDRELDFSQRKLSEINRYGDVIYNVEVEYDAYHQVKGPALKELEKIYQGDSQARIKLSTAQDILGELSFSGYQWNPGLGDLENKLTNENEKQLARYLLGGLIFGGYAQIMETEHLLQPKRSRVFAALAIGADGASRKLEEELFGELKKRAHTPIEEVPWMPTFFPYVLDKVNNSSEILGTVIKLRNSSEIKDYRIWLTELLKEWKQKGKISEDKRKDIKRVEESILKKLTPSANLPSVEFKANIAEIFIGKLPGPEVNFTKPLQALWGWILEGIPGNRYRKILTRAVLADHAYANLETAMDRVWKG